MTKPQQDTWEVLESLQEKLTDREKEALSTYMKMERQQGYQKGTAYIGKTKREWYEKGHKEGYQRGLQEALEMIVRVRKLWAKEGRIVIATEEDVDPSEIPF